MKKGKPIFSIINQKIAKAVRLYKQHFSFLSDKDFINALESNSIKGYILDIKTYFGQRDLKIANEIYG